MIDEREVQLAKQETERTVIKEGTTNEVRDEQQEKQKL
jgi:hypothetical protein